MCIRDRSSIGGVDAPAGRNVGLRVGDEHRNVAVSYTHLDVYKRQVKESVLLLSHQLLEILAIIAPIAFAVTGKIPNIHYFPKPKRQLLTCLLYTSTYVEIINILLYWQMEVLNKI